MCLAEEIPPRRASLKVDVLGSFRKASFKSVYEFREQIGEGAFGTVYKGNHVLDSEETYAVKVMYRESKSDEKSALNEMNILNHLRGTPNVIELIDFYMETEEMYCVLALAEGGDVFDRLSRLEIYTEQNACNLAKTLLTTVNNIHERGVVHRDLKPENLLLKSMDDDAEILVCDFDHAKRLESSADVMITMCGTPAYAAPEMIQGVEYGPKVDYWSVGCIIYFLLCGYLPFGDGCEAFEFAINGDFGFEDKCWESVSTDAKDLVSNLLKVDPEERYTAIQALECSWFQAGERLERNSLSAPLKCIRNYCARRKIKAAVHALLSLERMKSLMSFTADKSMVNTNVIGDSCITTIKKNSTHAPPMKPLLEYCDEDESTEEGSFSAEMQEISEEMEQEPESEEKLDRVNSMERTEGEEASGTEDRIEDNEEDKTQKDLDSRENVAKDDVSKENKTKKAKAKKNKTKKASTKELKKKEVGLKQKEKDSKTKGKKFLKKGKQNESKKELKSKGNELKTKVSGLKTKVSGLKKNEKESKKTNKEGVEVNEKKETKGKRTDKDQESKKVKQKKDKKKKPKKEDGCVDKKGKEDKELEKVEKTGKPGKEEKKNGSKKTKTKQKEKDPKKKDKEVKKAKESKKAKEVKKKEIASRKKLKREKGGIRLKIDEKVTNKAQ